MKFTIAKCLCGLSAAIAFGSTATAQVQLLFEQVIPSGQDLIMASYPSLTDMVNDTNRTNQSLALQLNPGLNLGGFSADGSGFRLLFEQVTPSGQDLIMASYPSLTDLVNDTNRTNQSLALQLNPGINLGGFSADGSGFRLLFEQVTPSGQDLIMASYPSLTDMVNDTNRTNQSLALQLNPGINLGGFSADGSGFRLLFEQVTPSGQDLIMASYPSLTDMVNDTNRTNQSLVLQLNPGLNLGGFDIQNSSTPVPDSGSRVLPLFALAAVAIMSRAFRRID